MAPWDEREASQAHKKPPGPCGGPGGQGRQSPEALPSWSLLVCELLDCHEVHTERVSCWVGTGRGTFKARFLHPPGSRAGLLPPSPLRTARASFPAGVALKLTPLQLAKLPSV